MDEVEIIARKGRAQMRGNRRTIELHLQSLQAAEHEDGVVEIGCAIAVAAGAVTTQLCGDKGPDEIGGISQERRRQPRDLQHFETNTHVNLTPVDRMSSRALGTPSIRIPTPRRFFFIMTHELLHKRVAILAADGFEQVELTKPKEALEEAGATVSIISTNSDQIQGMHHADKGDSFDVDMPVNDAHADEFDALMIPGGLMNPDTLRSTPEALEFVRAFFRAGKPVAAICHAPWVLIDAGVVRGRRLTSWPAIQSDVKNAGGTWVDEEVVVDNGLVTSRRPDDIPAFNRKMIEEFAEGIHAKQSELAAHRH